MVSIDREWALTFARHLWKRFWDDECFQTAGALSYTTIFALVPLTTAVFGILSAFPVFSVWTQELIDFVFRNFVPAAGATVRDYLLQFAANANKMTAVGVLVLLGSALLTMSSIEGRLNRIWRVKKQRSRVARFLLYWTALTLVPILLVGGLAMSSYLFALPILHGAALASGLQAQLLRLLPFLTTLAALWLLYVLVPNRRVAARHAAIGALLGACLFECAKWGFAVYVSNVPTYQQLYGALAVVPIFLIWVYLSWVIVLLGASVTASLTSFEYRPRRHRLPAGCEFLGLLRVIRQFIVAQREGRALHAGALQTNEPFLSDDFLQRCLADLEAVGWIQQTQDLGWVLVRSLDTMQLAQIYAAGAYRLPLDMSQQQQAWIADLPDPVHELLTALDTELHDGMKVSLQQLFPAGAPAHFTDKNDLP